MPRKKGRKSYLGKALRPLPSELIETCVESLSHRCNNMSKNMQAECKVKVHFQTLLDGFSFHLCLTNCDRIFNCGAKIGNFHGMFQEKTRIFYAGSTFLTLPRVRKKIRYARG